MWLPHHSRHASGKESARTHDVSAAPLPDLHVHSSIKQDVGARFVTATRSVG